MPGALDTIVMKLLAKTAEERYQTGAELMRELRDYKNVLADYVARTQRSLNHVRDFLDCVKSRRQPVANPEVMSRSMNICLAADICERLKRNLKFDLRKAEFVGDPEANRMRSRAMRAPFMD